MHHFHKALYLRQTKKEIQPNPVFVVNRRTLAFFPHLKLPNTLLLDISHQDFAGYRTAYDSIKVSLAEFTEARRVVKCKTITLNHIKSGYNSEIKGIQTCIQKWAFCSGLYFSSHTAKSGITSLKCSSCWPLIVVTKDNYAGSMTPFWSHRKYYLHLCSWWSLIQFIKFFENAFPKSLRTHLENLDAHLFLMCCGGIFRVEKMYNQYVDLAKTCVYPFTLNITDLS